MHMAIGEGNVVVYSGEAAYPEQPPFSPSLSYPEYEFGGELSTEPNACYESVRNTFRIAGLDASAFGSSAWNPLGGLIRKGEVVLLKPNLVKESHPRDERGWRYVLTHGSVIRAVADYVFKAIGHEGKVIIGDAPQTDSSFSAIVHTLGLDRLRSFYADHGLTMELVDFRQEEWENVGGIIVARRQLSGDPQGCVAFDLGNSSEFANHSGGGRYYGADYDVGVVNRHHTNGHHEYLIAGTAIKCDVLFSLPKLKTHKKAGITVSLKNLVGINGDKNWLPHHTEGPRTQGGDEHPDPPLKHRVERRALKTFRRLSLAAPLLGTFVHRGARLIGRPVFGDTETVVRNGNWWGNETIWRMCLDLNKLLLYGADDGTLRAPTPENRKRHFVLVDGIIAGEGRGPMNPDPVEAGLVLFGVHAPSVDAACAILMGFDPEKIPIVRQSFRCRDFPLSACDWRDVHVISNRPEWQRKLPEIAHESTFHFRPHFGWTGHIERDLSTHRDSRIDLLAVSNSTSAR